MSGTTFVFLVVAFFVVAAGSSGEIGSYCLFVESGQCLVPSAAQLQTSDDRDNNAAVCNRVFVLTRKRLQSASHSKRKDGGGWRCSSPLATSSCASDHTRLTPGPSSCPGEIRVR